jgi:hypothetical protein
LRCYTLINILQDFIKVYIKSVHSEGIRGGHKSSTPRDHPKLQVVHRCKKGRMNDPRRAHTSL